MRKLFLMAVMSLILGMSAFAQNSAPFTRVNCTLRLKDLSYRAQLIQKASELVAASLKDEGVKDYDFLMSVNDDFTFLIFETWDNASVLQKHMQTPHFTTLIPQIQELADLTIEQFDQPANPQDKGNGYRLNFSFNKTIAEIEIMKPFAQQLIRNSHLEEECRGYNIFVSLINPGFCLLFEDWPSQAALDRHLQTNHYKDNIKYVTGGITNRKIERFFYDK